jgi:YggT family protein
MSLLGEILDTILSALDFILLIYIWIIIISALLSWVQANPRNPIVELLDQITRPILLPIQRKLFRLTLRLRIDFSPVVAIVILEILRVLIRHLRILLAGF